MQHAPITKYRPQPVVALPDRRWPARDIASIPAPAWCSVDLRDGNQALRIPMGVAEKLEMFQLLVRLGFKEIEIGFPSANDTEFAFCRRLIEERLIPADVSVQVLVQCREHLIERTFAALDGAASPIVHIYNSTSPLQRRVTFGGASRDDIKRIAVEGARMVKARAARVPGLQLEYSPESFSDTEPEFALEVCEAVAAVWEPTPAEPIIFNLPETVQWTTPNVYADRIEWFARNLRDPASAVLSLHTHNDRGTGVAATELGLLAGATRVEGTLFGNGERTGNLDIITVALNLYTHGVDPRLDLGDLPAIRAIYERCTRMSIHDRHPYAGTLVFTAFSGSHQDAIKKGLDLRHEETARAAAAAPSVAANNASAAPAADNAPWAVPYLTIDPADIGHGYEDLIRINSQSGKGGIAYVLSRVFGLNLPKAMHPQVGEAVGTLAERARRDLSPDEIHAIFREKFVNLRAPLHLESHAYLPVAATESAASDAAVATSVRLRFDLRHEGRADIIQGIGTGHIDALANAMKTLGLQEFTFGDYHAHSVGAGSDSTAVAYIWIRRHRDNAVFWGCGMDRNTETANLSALVSAYNRAATET